MGWDWTVSTDPAIILDVGTKVLCRTREFIQRDEFFINENVASPMTNRRINHSKTFAPNGESHGLREKSDD